MNDQLAVKALIKSVVDVDVYPDFIPESAPDTAIAYYNVAFPFKGRVLEGSKYGAGSTWRIEVTSNSTQLVWDNINKVLSLDNTKTESFQRIFADVVNLGTKEPLQTYRRAFIDLTVYR